MSENKRRYLAPKARRGDGHGYVDMPIMGMHEEPECLTEAEWKLHVGGRDEDETREERKQAFAAKQLEDARRLLSFEERLTAATAEARAAKHRLDISSEVRLLRQMQQQGKEVRHLEQRLFVIERKVWRADKDAA
jgi:hypothetical protein